MSELARLELSLGSEFNECSIAAAELSKRAYDILSHTGLSQEKRFVVFENDAESEYDISFVPVSFDFTTESGRTCRLLLGKEVIAKSKKQSTYGQPRLYVVTHGNIALPLASFTRRAGSSCDHVQIGDEMYGDDMIVTPVDEMSRFDVIELLRRQFSNNIELYRYQVEIEDAKRNSNNDLLRQEIESLSHSQRGYIDHKATKEECELHAVCNALDLPYEVHGSKASRWKSSEGDKGFLLTYTTRLHYKRANSKLREFLENNPTIEQILSRNVVGGFSAVGRKFLLNHVSKTLGFTSNAANIDQVFKVDERYDAYIGETTRPKEGLYRAVNQLAINSSVVLEMVRKNTKISKTTGDVELKLTINRVGSAVNTIGLKARPVALEDAEFATVIDGVRIEAKQPIELGEADISELLVILDEIAVKGIRREIQAAW